jgi:hypothetical protein
VELKESLLKLLLDSSNILIYLDISWFSMIVALQRSPKYYHFQRRTLLSATRQNSSVACQLLRTWKRMRPLHRNWVVKTKWPRCLFFSESWPKNTRAEAGTNNRGRRGHSQAKVTFVRPPFGWLWIVPIEKSSCNFKQITECWNLRWHWAFTKKPTISNNLWVPMRQVDTCEGVLQPTQRYVWNDVKALKPLGTVNLFPPNYGSFSWKRKATGSTLTKWIQVLQFWWRLLAPSLEYHWMILACFWAQESCRSQQIHDSDIKPGCAASWGKVLHGEGQTTVERINHDEEESQMTPWWHNERWTGVNTNKKPNKNH